MEFYKEVSDFLQDDVLDNLVNDRQEVFYEGKQFDDCMLGRDRTRRTIRPLERYGYA